MKVTSIIALIFTVQQGFAQTPVIKDSACPIKIDSSFRTRCGYLIVPENRNKNNGKTIKLPFIIAYSKNAQKKKDPLLFTTGGPGGSSLGWITDVIKHSPILDRDCIAFEQRGTYYAIPNLVGPELNDAVREAYRKNLNKDSMMVEGVKRFKADLVAKGIDLSGYNTDETVDDIDDLLKILQIDSVNLMGVSYSGGLMLDVLKKDPARIRSLILDSPLPNFVPIDEDEPANLNEALKTLFGYCERDSSDQAKYGGLFAKFQRYFTSLQGRVFTETCMDKSTGDSVRVQYTRSDLLDIIEGRMFHVPTIKDIPYMITEMMAGRYEPYIHGYLEGMLNDGGGSNGMRMSVYCADQTAYHDERILTQMYDLYPYMRGYHINDPYKIMCDCWNVPPIRPESKQPFYSDRPALLADGALDPACRPLYIAMVHHYLPNSQRLVFRNRSHVVLFNSDMDARLKAFLDDPYAKVDVPENLDR